MNEFECHQLHDQKTDFDFIQKSRILEIQFSPYPTKETVFKIKETSLVNKNQFNGEIHSSQTVIVEVEEDSNSSYPLFVLGERFLATDT
jgi:hypothetical protein